MKKIINGLMSNLRKYLVLGTSLKNEAQPDLHQQDVRRRYFSGTGDPVHG